MSTQKVSSEKYRKLLVEAGCQVEAELSSGHLGFTDGGLSYLLRIDRDDDGFLEVVLPYELETDPAPAIRYEVCNYVSMTYKLVKCFYIDDTVYLTAEAFVNGSDEFKRFFRYAMNSLHVAYETVVEKYPDGV